MERSINFVQNRRQKLTKNQLADLKIFKIVGGVFGVAVGLFLIVLVGVFYLQFRINAITTTQKQLETSIANQEDVEQSVVVTIEKLKVLTELFDLRYDKQAAIEYFSNIFGPDVLIKDINYQAEERILSLRLQSASVFVLEEVFEKLANPEVEEKFGLVNKSGLTRNSAGQYGMAITLSLEEKDAKKPTAARPAVSPTP